LNVHPPALGSHVLLCSDGVRARFVMKRDISLTLILPSRHRSMVATNSTLDSPDVPVGGTPVTVGVGDREGYGVAPPVWPQIPGF
jgi:hypothetical protein